MFSVPDGITVHICVGITDMRKGCYTLASKVKQELRVNPLCGEVFVFLNRTRVQVKLLWFDGDGFALLAKRLEEGTFAVSRDKEGYERLEGVDLNRLLKGVPLNRILYQRKIAKKLHK